jgi:hypothetical protein
LRGKRGKSATASARKEREAMLSKKTGKFNVENN